MTLKDFLKARKECVKVHKSGDLRRDKECEVFLRENGLKKDEFDEIILELKNSDALKWWNEMLFDYLLEKAEKGDSVALAIKDKFNLDELSLAELKRLLRDDEFIGVLYEFWQGDIAILGDI